MNFIEELDGQLAPAEAVFAALSRAEDVVSRLDERVRGCGFSEGWRSRADVRAVIGAMAREGHGVHPEDLILHDLGADVRLPDSTVVRARQLLQARRRAASGGEELLSWAGVAWLCGEARQAPPPGRRPSTAIPGVRPVHLGYAGIVSVMATLSKGEAASGRPGVEECLAIFDLSDLPPLLAAATFLEAWRLVEPLPRHRPIGALVTGLFLKTVGRFSNGLFPVEVALSRRPMPGRLAWSGPGERLVYWLGTFELAARLELEELTRLTNQKALIERKAAGGRRSSRAPQLAALALNTPVITTESVTRALGVTPQASLQLIGRMGASLHEITGRSRFRVWRL